METEITFMSDEYLLSGLLCVSGGSKRGAVITHPHPLYGGNMYNPVVETIESVLRNNGYTTLRFDFRGVGGSEGVYGNGVSERRDVVSAITYLHDMEIGHITLAGYSFGSWVNAGVNCEGYFIDRMIAVSPPVAFMDYSTISETPCLDLVIGGERDEIGPPEMIRNHLPDWNPGAQFRIVEDADHFYSGRLGQLAGALDTAVGELDRN